MNAAEQLSAIQALAKSVEPIGDAITRLSDPTLYDLVLLCVQIVLAVLTLVAIYYTARTAKAAAESAAASNRSADAAELQAKTSAQSVQVAKDAIAREEVREYRREFDEAEYFMRFWRLDMLSRDPGTVPLGSLRLDVLRSRNGHSETRHSLGPSALSENLSASQLQTFAVTYVGRLQNNPDLSEIVYDALGPELSTTRADLYAVYYFALKLAAFNQALGPQGIDYLTQVFGAQLVMTFGWHRLLAGRLIPRPPLDSRYYASAYGLLDPAYATLVSDLYFAATDRSLLDDNWQMRLPDIERYLLRVHDAPVSMMLLSQ